MATMRTGSAFSAATDVTRNMTPNKISPMDRVTTRAVFLRSLSI